jgi:Ceramidase
MQWRHIFLFSLVIGSFVALMWQAPIKQDLAYHAFIDGRTLFGVPNFYNVISNLPFLFVGIAGVIFCRANPVGNMPMAWLIFFAGIGLVSFGSAYYHWNPDSAALVWDRLPMTIGFMGLFAALLGEFVSTQFGKRMLLPLLVIGIASVLVWHWFDDLRFYAWVQFMPLLVIPFLLWLYPKRFSHSHYWLYALAFYLAAKVFEAFDTQIFNMLGQQMSGHAIKHVLAAIGSFMVLQMLRVRKPLIESA